MAASLIDKDVIREWGLLRIKHSSTSALHRTHESLRSDIEQFHLALESITRVTR